MIEYTTRYDVKKTMYEKFADSAAQHTNEPCFYYYNNTITWAQAEKMVDLAPQVCSQTVSERATELLFAHLICRSALQLYMR